MKQELLKPNKIMQLYDQSVKANDFFTNIIFFLFHSSFLFPVQSFFNEKLKNIFVYWEEI